MSKSFGKTPILGGPFGPQENSICQAAAIGAGGLSSLFVATLPAMYRLHLLSENPKDDFSKFITLCLVGSFFGVMFAVPLRKFFIINVARELRLVFPTCRFPSCPCCSGATNAKVLQPPPSPSRSARCMPSAREGPKR